MLKRKQNPIDIRNILEELVVLMLVLIIILWQLGPKIVKFWFGILGPRPLLIDSKDINNKFVGWNGLRIIIILPLEVMIILSLFGILGWTLMLEGWRNILPLLKPWLGRPIRLRYWPQVVDRLIKLLNFGILMRWFVQRPPKLVHKSVTCSSPIQQISWFRHMDIPWTQL